MSERAGTRYPGYALLGAAVLALGLLVRAVPLWWSTLPATMDGFRYASLAEATLADGRLPLARLDADEAFTLVLATASAVTGIPPLRLAQRLAVAVGAAAPLAGVALVRWAGRDCGLSPRRTWRAAAVVGLALAVEGLFVRRTGVPDEEQLTPLVVALLAVVFARAVTTRRPAHTAVTVGLMAVLPAIHNLATVVALTTVTGVFVLLALRRPARSRLVVGGWLLAGFWLYSGAYYAAASTGGATLTYVDLVVRHAGLFVAWLVLLVVGVAWMRSLGPRHRWAAGTVSLVVPFGLLAANLARPVFPGTITTPPFVAMLVVPLVVPAVLAPMGLGLARGVSGDVLLALLAAPLVLVFYALSASLTPPVLGAVMRTQTYLHVPVFALAGLAAVAFGDRLRAGVPTAAGRPLGGAALGVLLVAAAVTAPAGHVDLDTGASPSTAMESQFDAVAVAVSGGQFATDDDLARIGELYFHGTATTASTRRWLSGGSPPDCALLAERSWTASGAHFYPAAPATTSVARFEAVLTSRHVVYANTGRVPLVLALPRVGRGSPVGECR